MASDSFCRGFLILLKNGQKESEFPVITETCFIGRSTECDVRLKNININDKHCLIKVAVPRKITVYSLCSEKPVLLNNEPVTIEGSMVQHGDLIQILDNIFRWEDAESQNAENSTNRNSLPTVKKLVPEFIEQNRYSAPELPCEVERENIDPETKLQFVITPRISPVMNLATGSPAVKKITPSCSEKRSPVKQEQIKQVFNSHMKNINKSRRSRSFSKTFKAPKSEIDTSGKKTIISTLRISREDTFTPSEEKNRTPSKEVKSRYELNRSTLRKSAVCLFRKDVCVKPKPEDSIVQHLGETDRANENLLEECQLDVKDDNDITKQETIFTESTENNQEGTFETTAGRTNENSFLLPTPKCFNKAYHSTPKFDLTKKNNFLSNLENSENSVEFSASVTDCVHPDRNEELTTVQELDSKSLSVSPVKPAIISNTHFSSLSRITVDNQLCLNKSKLKKESELFRSTFERSIENRRHTRGTSNILKKTFEEHNEDNLATNEKSLTTPEKCTSNITSDKITVTDETEFESYSPEKKLESNSEHSAENGVTSFQDENRERSNRSDDSSTTRTRCTRNLSYISPPENNKSQEFMDSVVSTPKKALLNGDEIKVSSVFAKGSVDENVSSSRSPGRNRRSTGIVPCVGTPSEVYRITKGILTPANKSRFNRTSMEVEVSVGPRDSLSGLIKSSKRFPRKRSSERKLTPVKVNKSSVRDSLQLHSPIIEDYSLENEEESQNDSTSNDSKFKFVSRRRRRFLTNSFAEENRIMEESETNHSPKTSDDESIEAEGSLTPLDSLDEENSALISTRIIVNPDSNINDHESSTDGTEMCINDTESKLVDDSTVKNSVMPKSILTPLPRLPSTIKEKSAKKVTFRDVKDSPNSCAETISSAYSVFTNETFSSFNTSKDIKHSDLVDINKTQNDNEENEKLYISDVSSSFVYVGGSALSSTDISTTERFDTAERSKQIKRLKTSRKGLSLHLSGKRLFKAPKTPKSDCFNVSGIKKLMESPESITKLLNTPKKSTSTMEAVLEIKKPSLFVSNEQLSIPNFNMQDVDVSPKYDPSTEEKNSNYCKTDDDSTFCTPLVRRCSKHFRVHRTSLCPSLASSLNSTIQGNELHDCSASLENSIVEEEITENESVKATQTPRTLFQNVLVQLKEKLMNLQNKLSLTSLNSTSQESELNDCSTSLENLVSKENISENESTKFTQTQIVFGDVVELDEKVTKLQNNHENQNENEELKNKRTSKVLGLIQNNDVEILETSQSPIKKIVDAKNNVSSSTHIKLSVMEDKSENFSLQKEQSFNEQSLTTEEIFTTCNPVSKSIFMMETDKLKSNTFTKESAVISQMFQSGKTQCFFETVISPVVTCENTNNMCSSNLDPIDTKMNENLEIQLMNVTFDADDNLSSLNKSNATVDQTVEDKQETANENQKKILSSTHTDICSSPISAENIPIINEEFEAASKNSTETSELKYFTDETETSQSISISKISEKSISLTPAADSISETEKLDDGCCASVEGTLSNSNFTNYECIVTSTKKQNPNFESYDSYENCLVSAENSDAGSENAEEIVISQNEKNISKSIDIYECSPESRLSVIENVDDVEESITLDSTFFSEDDEKYVKQMPTIPDSIYDSQNVKNSIQQLSISSVNKLETNRKRSNTFKIIDNAEQINCLDGFENNATSLDENSENVLESEIPTFLPKVDQKVLTSPTPVPGNFDVTEEISIGLITVSENNEKVERIASNNSAAVSDINKSSAKSSLPFEFWGNNQENSEISDCSSLNLNNSDVHRKKHPNEIPCNIPKIVITECTILTENGERLDYDQENDERITVENLPTNSICVTESENEISKQFTLEETESENEISKQLLPQDAQSESEILEKSTPEEEVEVLKRTEVQLEDNISWNVEKSVSVHENATVTGHPENSEISEQALQKPTNQINIDIESDCEFSGFQPAEVMDEDMISNSLSVTTKTVATTEEKLSDPPSTCKLDISMKSDENLEKLTLFSSDMLDNVTKTNTSSLMAKSTQVSEKIMLTSGGDTSGIVSESISAVEFHGGRLSVVIEDIIASSATEPTPKTKRSIRNGKRSKLLIEHDGSRDTISENYEMEQRTSTRIKNKKDQGNQSNVQVTNQSKSSAIVSNAQNDVSLSEEVQETRSAIRKTIHHRSSETKLVRKRPSRLRNNETVNVPTLKKKKMKNDGVNDWEDSDVELLSSPKQNSSVEELISPFSIILTSELTADGQNIPKVIKNLHTKANEVDLITDLVKKETRVNRSKRGYNFRKTKIFARNENLVSNKSKNLIDTENATDGKKHTRKTKLKNEVNAVIDNEAANKTCVSSAGIRNKRKQEIDNLKNEQIQPAGIKRAEKRINAKFDELPKPHLAEKKPVEHCVNDALPRTTRNARKVSSKSKSKETVEITISKKNTRRGAKIMEKRISESKINQKKISKAEKSTNDVSSDEKTSEEENSKRINLRSKKINVLDEKDNINNVRVTRNRKVDVNSAIPNKSSSNERKADPVDEIKVERNMRITRNRKETKESAITKEISLGHETKTKMSSCMTVAVVRVDESKIIAKKRLMSNSDEISGDERNNKKLKMSETCTVRITRSKQVISEKKNETKKIGKVKNEAKKTVKGKNETDTKKGNMSKKEKFNSSGESADEGRGTGFTSTKSVINRRNKKHPSPKNEKIANNRSKKLTKEPSAKGIKKLNIEVSSPAFRVTRSRNKSVCSTRLHRTKK